MNILKFAERPGLCNSYNPVSHADPNERLTSPFLSKQCRPIVMTSFESIERPSSFIPLALQHLP